MKSSLLKYCDNVKIRGDLADCGMYIFTFQLYKLMLHLFKEKDYHWFSIQIDFLPFLARKQFKHALNKMFEDVQKDKQTLKKVPAKIKDCALRIEQMLNPDNEIKKD